jgi:capsular polysaccharide biosynthesis protein
MSTIDSSELKMESPSKTVLISLAIVVAIFGALLVAYNAGLLDPIIEKTG